MIICIKRFRTLCFHKLVIILEVKLIVYRLERLKKIERASMR
jgi:hypothetical protein